MDFGGNMFCLNGNSNGFAWDSWETATTTCNSSRLDINAFHTTVTAETSSVNLPHADVGGVRQQQLPYGGDGSHRVHVDPHLTCLKLGKRQYFEDASGGDKRGKGCYGGGGVKAAVPRCQVEGCQVALVNAKEYHRRHKVCEMHSKAPKVVVLGMEQRFCQQCSRFHVVSEFDDSKRSCRRRLAGHNERRRKSSHDSVARNSSQGECALSLLSAKRDSWLSPADLSTRCSAALRELIAENRAASMARLLVSDRDWNLHHHPVDDFREIQPESNYFPQQMFPQTQ